MTTSISDSGVQFATGNIVNVSTSMPATGSFTAGDIVFENTTAARISGWKRLTTGSNHVLGTDWSYFSGITSGTAVATTSGTAIDFTGIPSWVKRITLMLSGVSTNSTGGLRVQIGSGSIQSSSYGGDAITAPAGGSLSGNQFSVGFDVTPGTQTAASVHTGAVTLSLMGSNIWLMSSAIGREDSNALATGGGRVLGSGTLDRIRLTTTNGTDTFDAGSVNILWE